MTNINTVGMSQGTDTPDYPKKANSNNELSPDDFIKLFLAQLKHQNPMSPTDSSAILQQMSQISTISASKSMQKTMESLEQRVEHAMAGNQFFQASHIIGHQIELESSTGILGNNKRLHGSAFVPGAASEVTIDIKDTMNNTVKTLHLGTTSNGGLVDFDWDGKDEDGKECSEGTYKISAKAVVNGNEQTVGTALAYTVKSIAMDSNGNTVLNAEGMGGVQMQNVVKVL